VFVGTDRIQAFGLHKPGEKPLSLATPGPPEMEMKMTPIGYGKSLYNTGGACATCHQQNGQGVPNVFPPLASSEWVNGSEDRLIRIMLHGLQDPVRVAGTDYSASAIMPGFGQVAGSAFNWTDEKIARVATYIRQEWGNHAPRVSPEKVSELRQQIGDHKPWTQEELIQIRDVNVKP
jgi:mono/diheme cytochrome c family protein